MVGSKMLAGAFSISMGYDDGRGHGHGRDRGRGACDHGGHHGRGSGVPRRDDRIRNHVCHTSSVLTSDSAAGVRSNGRSQGTPCAPCF